MPWRRDESTTLEELEERLRDHNIVRIEFSDPGKPRRVSVTACAVIDDRGCHTTCYVHGAATTLEDALDDVEMRVKEAEREILAESSDWDEYPTTREYA